MTAARLRSAAARLREVAEAATPGPWMPTSEDFGRLGIANSSGARVAGAEDGYGGVDHDADQAYIAAMSPPVALALADWFDKLVANEDGTAIYLPNSRDVTAAERIADAVLGDREQVPS